MIPCCYEVVHPYRAQVVHFCCGKVVQLYCAKVMIPCCDKSVHHSCATVVTPCCAQAVLPCVCHVTGCLLSIFADFMMLKTAGIVR